MLIGEYAVALGDKNRIALPKKLRLDLSDELIITRGYEGCALILDKSRWQTLVSSIGQHSLFRLTARDTRRYLLGGASELELDKQGRFVIPDYILAHAKVQTCLSLIGVGEWVELWATEVWQEKSEYLARNAADIAQSLSESNR